MSDVISNAVVQFGVSGLEQVKGALGSVKSGLGNMGISLGALGVVAGLGATVSMAVKKAMDAEQATTRLKAALAASGEEVEKNVAGFKKLAEEIQRATNQSKGETQALVEKGLQMGLTMKQSEQYALYGHRARKENRYEHRRSHDEFGEAR